jgi:hypothetical protein
MIAYFLSIKRREPIFLDKSHIHFYEQKEKVSDIDSDISCIKFDFIAIVICSNLCITPGHTIRNIWNSMMEETELIRSN